jgi:hypothetical protein
MKWWKNGADQVSSYIATMKTEPRHFIWFCKCVSFVFQQGTGPFNFSRNIWRKETASRMLLRREHNTEMRFTKPGVRLWTGFSWPVMMSNGGRHRREHNIEMGFTKPGVKLWTGFSWPVMMSNDGSVRTTQMSGFHKMQLSFLSSWVTLDFLRRIFFQGLSELVHHFPLITVSRLRKMYTCSEYNLATCLIVRERPASSIVGYNYHYKVKLILCFTN